MRNLLGRRIQEGLERNNMSQRELADMIGKDYSTVSCYINGDVLPDNCVLADIESVLQITLDDMYGYKIYRLLKENNMTQNELASQIGISQPTISCCINMIRTPSYSIMNDIASALHSSPEYIFGHDEYFKKYIMDIRFNSEVFTNRLSTLLTQNNINGTTLALKIGKSPASINGYIHRKNNPSYDTLVSIANALHCSVEYLVGMDNEND